MSVDFQHLDYLENADRWRMMQDVCSGSRAVKRANTLYLPMINFCSDYEANWKRYEAYLKRAVFYPITKNTLQTHVGLAFAEDPTFDPDGMDFLKDNADGLGTSIYQLNQKALGILLKFGRGGFLVDYPTTQGGVTPADIQTRGIRPIMALYDAFNIINWRVKKIGNEFRTSLVVLREFTNETDPLDEFKEQVVTNYRVLRLDENNEYSIQVYSDRTGELLAGDLIYPTINGKRLNEILFFPVGAQVNDFSIDEIPLEPVAEINLAHYRNSAEYEQSVFFTNQVQPVFSELDDDDAERLESDGVMLGSATPLVLRGTGKFNYVTAPVDTLAKEAMDDKKQYMQDLGAKLLDSSAVNKTATQVNSDDATNHSVLSLCVSNLNEAMEYCLKWCAAFYGSGGNARFTIKQDFARGRISLEDLKFYQSEVVAGRMSAKTLHEIMATGKIPELDFDEERLRIEESQTQSFV